MFSAFKMDKVRLKENMATLYFVQTIRILFPWTCFEQLSKWIKFNWRRTWPLLAKENPPLPLNSAVRHTQPEQDLYAPSSKAKQKKCVCFRLLTIPKFRSPTLTFLLSFFLFFYNWFFSQKYVFSFKSVFVATYIKSIKLTLGQINLVSCFMKILAKRSRSEDGKSKKIKIGE